jgi:hypothetical protein
MCSVGLLETERRVVESLLRRLLTILFHTRQKKEREGQYLTMAQVLRITFPATFPVIRKTIRVDSKLTTQQVSLFLEFLSIFFSFFELIRRRWSTSSAPCTWPRNHTTASTSLPRKSG